MTVVGAPGSHRWPPCSEHSLVGQSYLDEATGGCVWSRVDTMSPLGGLTSMRSAQTLVPVPWEIDSKPLGHRC